MYEIAIALSVLCFLIVGLYFVNSPNFSAFHPFTFYCAFHGLLFVIRPILSLVLKYDLIYNAYGFEPSDSDRLTAILASNLGFLAFAFFCLRSGGVPMQFKQDSFAIVERNRLKTIFPWVAVVCIPIATYSLVSLWNAAGEGVAYADMIRDKRTGFSINTTGNGYLYEAQLMLASCGAIIGWIFRFRLLAIMPLIAFVVLRAGTGGRGPFITALTTLSLLYFYETRQKFPGIKLLLSVTIAAILFSAVGQDRGRSVREAFGAEKTAEAGYSGVPLKFMEGMDFGNLEYFEYLIYVVPQRSHTYDYFLDNLQIFTEPVPRVLWKNKPIGAPFTRIYLFDYGFPIGMTKSLPGEGWFAFGWAGVVIWCGLWGHFLGLFYRKFVEGNQSSFQTITYLTFLPILIIAYRDGAIITILREGVFFFTPIFLWYMLSRYLGFPSAQDMRAAAARRLRRDRLAGKGTVAAIETFRGAGGDAGQQPVRTGHGLHPSLPPAVARRRALLGKPAHGPV